MTRARRTLAGIFGAVLIGAATPAQTKLLRFPDVHEATGKVVFTYAGDLWLASSQDGGVATRLTAHPGLELFAKFSPDGASIAFTGQYDGDEQVYVVPASGGVPRQLTYYPARGPLTPRWGYDNQVYGWSRDGKSVLFRSMRDGFDLTDTRLYLVPAEGGLPVALEMPVSGGGDLSPDMTKVVYSPLTRDFRTWKRYEGGWAQDLYVFDRATKAIEPVAHHKRTERDPMWIGDAIYFASDRDGVLNLYKFDPATKETTALTRESTWDVRWPSRGETHEIVYELDGELRVIDVRDGTSRKLSITAPDDGVSARPSQLSVGGQIEDFELSPKGERALFVARGDVFTAPIEKGAPRNLTRSSNAHDRVAAWSPDGARIAFVSDRSGEEEIWLVPQEGGAEAKQLTTDGVGRRRTRLSWAPDGTKILCVDQTGRVVVVDATTGASTDVAKDPSGEGGDATWSPDSAFVALSLGEPTGLRSIWIWSATEGLRRVTDESFEESEPVFDPNGEWLWYLSDRAFAPMIDLREWNYAADRQTGVFGLALRADVKNPFAPESDEVEVQKKGEGDSKPSESTEGEKSEKSEKDADADKKDDKEAKKPVVIAWEGLSSRVVRVPIDAGNIRNLNVGKDALFFQRGGAFYYGRESYQKSSLRVFSMKDRKETTLVDEAGGYAMSADRSKLLVAEGGGFHRVDAAPGGGESKKTVSTEGFLAERTPRDEWNVVFNEVWRRFRDYFYAPNMHGYDWPALRERYAAWLPHVAHRSDLNYVMGEMIAELNVGHAYVEGGDWEAPERPNVALLGAKFELDSASGRYRVASILAGQNEEETYRSPLTEVGVDAKVGDYLLAIDGAPLLAPDNPYRLLRGRARRPVELTLAATADGAAQRRVVVRPIASEGNLHYLAWVLRNRAMVDRLSGGRIGYLHIPDMGEDGIREFVKWYYGQTRKEGLIVDDRNNGGGNVSQMLIERLRRVLLATEYSRHTAYATTYPNVVFTGPMVCLLNENSASDGDIFPWMFRASGLGPLIGKRSWGGVVGISGHGPLLDGGEVFVPEFGHADAKGAWSVEGYGVDPDIVVENDPASVLAGRDPQLERGVAEVLRLMESKKAALPAPFTSS
jgi:tricorn protease